MWDFRRVNVNGEGGGRVCVAPVLLSHVCAIFILHVFSFLFTPLHFCLVFRNDVLACV